MPSAQISKQMINQNLQRVSNIWKQILLGWPNLPLETCYVSTVRFIWSLCRNIHTQYVKFLTLPRAEVVMIPRLTIHYCSEAWSLTRLGGISIFCILPIPLITLDVQMHVWNSISAPNVPKDRLKQAFATQKDHHTMYKAYKTITMISQSINQSINQCHGCTLYTV